MRLTKKQLSLIAAIQKGGERGELPDLNQILQNLNYETSKQSLQFSIRALVRKGVIEKRELEARRGQQRRVLSLTAAGYQIAAAHYKTHSADNSGTV